jgi:hypothetical protein
LTLRFGKKLVTTNGSVVLDLQRRIENVAKIEHVAAHSGTASLRTSSRT